MRPKVFIARKVPGEAEDYIAQYCDLEKWNGPGLIPRRELLKVLGESEGLLINGERIDQAFSSMLHAERQSMKTLLLKHLRAGKSVERG